MKTATPIVSIITIGLLCAYALYIGQNGLILAGAVACIAGLGGYLAPHKKPKNNGDST